MNKKKYPKAIREKLEKSGYFKLTTQERIESHQRFIDGLRKVNLGEMKTTYFLTHESINCPICGKLLRESKSYDEVACSDPQCRFNDSHSKENM